MMIFKYVSFTAIFYLSIFNHVDARENSYLLNFSIQNQEPIQIICTQSSPHDWCRNTLAWQDDKKLQIETRPSPSGLDMRFFMNTVPLVGKAGGPATLHWPLGVDATATRSFDLYTPHPDLLREEGMLQDAVAYAPGPYVTTIKITWSKM